MKTIADVIRRYGERVIEDGGVVFHILYIPNKNPDCDRVFVALNGRAYSVRDSMRSVICGKKVLRGAELDLIDNDTAHFFLDPVDKMFTFTEKEKKAQEERTKKFLSES